LNLEKKGKREKANDPSTIRQGGRNNHSNLPFEKKMAKEHVKTKKIKTSAKIYWLNASLLSSHPVAVTNLTNLGKTQLFIFISFRSLIVAARY